MLRKHHVAPSNIGNTTYCGVNIIKLPSWCRMTYAGLTSDGKGFVVSPFVPSRGYCAHCRAAWRHSIER